ncbi:hypothetical protein GCM10023205_53000 [Yinghuangia aomiensis]|uniref:Uncharacterized protein n=1 Tax=Yinghuangia aomiensis TaxID=676205 RepID=A0ABP9HU86_9ACTN
MPAPMTTASTLPSGCAVSNSNSVPPLLGVAEFREYSAGGPPGVAVCAGPPALGSGVPAEHCLTTDEKHFAQRTAVAKP